MSLLVALAPSANRVYAGSAPTLVAAELQIMLGADVAVQPVMVAGVPYLELDADDAATLAALGRLSAFHAAYERVGDLLRPILVTRPDQFEDDLVTIPKYTGKTNEQFTRLLVNVTVAALRRPADGPLSLLDPLSGRGTTLSTGLTLGYDVAGVEVEAKAVEAYAAFLKTYLRRKRVKHTVAVNPVRRQGRSLGRRLDAEITPPGGGRALTLSVFTGDTRQSAALYGKRRFDAVVSDAPYGVVHGSAASGLRERSAAGLLADALPVWAGQLKVGGALGLAWNSLGLTRERLTAIAVEAGLQPMAEGPYRQLAHRVDASIHRDVLVAVRPN